AGEEAAARLVGGGLDRRFGFGPDRLWRRRLDDRFGLGNRLEHGPRFGLRRSLEHGFRIRLGRSLGRGLRLSHGLGHRLRRPPRVGLPAGTGTVEVAAQSGPHGLDLALLLHAGVFLPRPAISYAAPSSWSNGPVSSGSKPSRAAISSLEGFVPSKNSARRRSPVSVLRHQSSPTSSTSRARSCDERIHARR